eukprot:UN29944
MHSDFDIALITEKKGAEVLSNLAECIKAGKCPGFTILREDVITAAIPTLKLYACFEKDTCFLDIIVRNSKNMELEMKCQKFMETVLGIDSRVKDFIFYIKNWAYLRGIIGGATGFPNGFGWLALGVFALRRWYGVPIKLPDDITTKKLIWRFFSHFLKDEILMSTKCYPMNLDKG